MKIVTLIIKYVVDNLYQIVNLIEAVLRVAAAIVPITPSPKDDAIVLAVKAGFDKIKSFLLKVTEK